MGKTDIKIKEKKEKVFRSKYAALIRQSKYRKDYKRYMELRSEVDRMDSLLHKQGVNKKRKETYEKQIEDLFSKMDVIHKKYDISEMIDPDNPESWKLIVPYNYSVIPEGRTAFWNLFYDVSTKDYEMFKVDIWRDKGVIKQEISEWIDVLRSGLRRMGYEGKSFDSVPNREIIERCCAVFELVQKGDERLTYKMIALKLKEKGFYKTQNLKQAEALARQDFKTACIRIEKIYKRRKSDSPKPIVRVPEAKKHIDDINKWNEILDACGLSMKEVFSEMGDAYIVSPENKDGHIKKGLMQEKGIEEQELLKEKERIIEQMGE